MLNTRCHGGLRLGSVHVLPPPARGKILARVKLGMDHVSIPRFTWATEEWFPCMTHKNR